MIIMFNDHTFCRILLKDVMVEVCKHVSKKDIKASWTWRSSSLRNTTEFHGPDNFCWHGQACCLWHAKVQGWEAYLRKIGVEGYEIGVNFPD